ncbi:MAG: hypothetical protein N3E50_03515 [Candidatus Goldbacteria bacterium]|nr:hypothetical protein [Candidatus Goldiibacteriota bacterium]
MNVYKWYFIKCFLGIIIGILFFPFFFSAFDLEVRGLYNKSQFSGFNDYRTDLFSYSFSIDARTDKINEMPGVELLLGIPVASGFAICACLSLGMIEWTDDLYDEYHKKTAVRSVARFVTGYAGLGAKYFLDAGMERLHPYLFYNLGFFKHLNSFWEVSADTSYYFVNPGYEYQKINFNDSFLGMNFEAGFDLRLFDSIGMVVFAGYKYGVFKLIFPDDGLFADAHYQDTDVDISGMYFGGGVKFYFDEFKIIKTDNLKGGWDYYNMLGDNMMKNKNYKGAIDNYKIAIKLSGPEDIYKKISFCFYKLNDIKNAVYYAEKYLEFFPQDVNMKKWVEKNK